jgi:hypothetical protein
MGLLSFGIHLLANALGGYGYFRDELYYLACSRHLAAGYVDQPPLSILSCALARMSPGRFRLRDPADPRHRLGAVGNRLVPTSSEAGTAAPPP